MRPLILGLSFLIATAASCSPAQQAASAPTATRTNAEQEILTLQREVALDVGAQSRHARRALPR
jgi:hypothetical protein